MKHFIQMWQFFNSEVDSAFSGHSELCGLSPLFCDMVIKKATAILSGPTREAIKETKLEQLCGHTPTGKYFYMYDIKEDIENQRYEIELALYTDSFPVHFIIAVPKDDFDKFLEVLMTYINVSKENHNIWQPNQVTELDDEAFDAFEKEVMNREPDMEKVEAAKKIFEGIENVPVDMKEAK